MQWPRLVPPAVCRTPCVVTLTGDLGEDGAPITLAAISTRCNWADKPRQILDAERRLITLSGAALFDGDIAPDVDILAGTVTLYGRDWVIYRGSKCRDPDGTVNYTRLELM